MMVTNHEMRMYSLNLFEILQAVDHTLTVHGHIDCGTPLHRRISAAITIPNEDPSGQRREPMSPHPLDEEQPFFPQCDLLIEALKGVLLDIDFMVERGIIPDIRNDIIYERARAALTPAERS